MARNDDDDDDDDRPKKRGARAEEEEEQQDEEDEEEERPRKKPAREEEDERDEAPAKGKKPLPGKLVAAAAASMAWGGFNLYVSCIESSNSLLGIIRSLSRGANERMFQGELMGGGGWMYTLAAVHVFSVLFAALLFVGGILLVRRMSLGKFAAMGAPVGMALTLLIGFVIALILTRGTFITQFFTATIVSFLFTVAVAGCNITMLMSKEASKAAEVTLHVFARTNAAEPGGKSGAR